MDWETEHGILMAGIRLGRELERQVFVQQLIADMNGGSAALFGRYAAFPGLRSVPRPPTAATPTVRVRDL